MLWIDLFKINFIKYNLISYLQSIVIVLIPLSVSKEKTHIYVNKTPTFQLNLKFLKTIIQEMLMVMKWHWLTLDPLPFLVTLS